MGLYWMSSNPDQRFYVYTRIDQGPDLRPLGGYCHFGPLTREEAEKVASRERSLPYILEVRIEEATEEFVWGSSSRETPDEGLRS